MADHRQTEAGEGLIPLALNDLHVELGARLVPYAGHAMPVQYTTGVMKEHLHTRASAGLFDVSHMGQIVLRPKGRIEELIAALETLVPVDLQSLAPGRQRYAIFTNESGGIIDDLMISRRGDHLVLVVNASRKAVDLDHLRAHLADHAVIEPVDNRALFALQGPLAEDVLSRHLPTARSLRFMDSVVMPSSYGPLWISRSGYTGEDGFEISVPENEAESVARALLEDPRVAPAGLGARDSLRLEAGLCLYGQDIDAEISPIEARLTWAIQKPRRTGGAREGGFPGSEHILAQLSDGPARVRVGLRPEGRAPMREGTPLFDGDTQVGRVTSGGFGPSVEAPIAMGYLPPALSVPGTSLTGEVRGKRLPVTVAPLPFHTPTYKR